MDKQIHRLLKGKKNRETFWDTTEKVRSRSRQNIDSIRWFILFWVGIVSLWGSVQLLLGNYVRLPFGGFVIIMGFIRLQAPFSNSIEHPLDSQLPPLLDHVYHPLDYRLGVIVVLVMTAHIYLHWICLSDRMRQHWYWLYFLIQGVCVLTINFLWSDMTITLGLYLVLVIEALSILKQIRQIVAVVANYLLIFILTMIWQLTQMTIRMTLESLFLLIVFIIGWIILSIQQIHARSQLETAHLQLAAYAMRVEELTLVNERQRLARELHDTLAQDLIGLTLQLERIDLHLDKKRFERARELVQQAMSQARTTLAASRSAIDGLRAHSLNSNDLLLALQREISRFTTTTSISCATSLSALSAVPENLCEHVLRTITEGLTNVARHSQAHQVSVCTQLNEATLTIEVHDDGIGFESSTVGTQKGHYGLLGLRERTSLVGGRLDIESSAGNGTTLRLYLPVNTRGGIQ